MVRRQVCHQCLCNRGLGMPDLESHWLAERLAFPDQSRTRHTVWGQKAKKAFPCLKSNPKAKRCRRLRGEAPFFAKCWKAFRNLPMSSDLSQSRKELYWELVVGTTSDLFDGIGRQVQVSWTTLSSLSPGGSLGTHYPSPAGLSRQALQTCLITFAVAVVWKKWLCMLSTTANKSTRFRVTLGSGWPTLIPNC